MTTPFYRLHLLLSLLVLSAMPISAQDKIHRTKRVVPKQAPEIKTKLNVHFLTNKNIIIVGDYSPTLKKIILSECNDYLKATQNSVWWSYEFSRDFAALEVVNAYRPLIAKRFAEKSYFSITDNSIVSNSYWMNATGKMRLRDPYKNNQEIELKNGVTVAHFGYLRLKNPLLQGKTYTLTTKAGEKLSFTYDENKITSRALKVNQVGYHPNAGQKFAYLGMWLGMKDQKSLSLDLKQWKGKKFYLVNKDKKNAFEGHIELRRQDKSDQKGFPVTGETVYQLDFSNFNKAGHYHIHVPGIGNSWPFKIHSDSIGEAFYTHTRGLYHKRCGIAKESPFTHWHMGACHQETFVGGHLSYDKDYKNITSSGKKVPYKPFQMIKDTATKEKLPIWGGWHDAADYDRRPLHFTIVQDLLTPYLMDPEKFTDGQLNIPESGNGLPDILDEADWGMRVWLRAQNENGSIGTWIEATSHPKEHNPSKDAQPYYISVPTRNSTMEYAAYAALIGHAYSIAGDKAKSQEYIISSEKAFKWALDPLNALKKNWKAQGKTYAYNEPELNEEMAFKAAINLFITTGNRSYLKSCERFRKAFLKTINDLQWYRTPFFFAEILTVNKNLLLRYQKQLAEALLQQADKTLLDMNNYAYRNPWWKLNHGYYTHMGWGTWHPLRKARTLVAAHYISGQQKYKDAAFLCNDFQLGCNALGRSMTSGLGTVYPVKFLDLPSYTDGIDEFVPGITPYLLTYGIYYNVKNLAFNLKVPARLDHSFKGLNTTILGNVDKVQPIYRRFGNLEGLSVPQDEYTVHETIGPAVGVTAYLIDPGFMPSEQLKNKKPKKFSELEGRVPTP